ncbi:MAG: outer membrane protein assembly factor BamC [Sterolibacterium sp.]
MKRNPVFTLLLSLFLTASILSGCGVFQSKKIDYKSSGKLPPLEVPPDLTTPNRDERYALPDTGSKGSATLSAYAGGQPHSSASSDVLPQVDKMRIERSGTQRWLVVSGTPDKLWPGIKAFWQEAGFTISVEKPEAGLMETDWNENRAKLPQDFIRNIIGKVFDSVYSTSERDKFRTRLEKSSEEGTTEIYISHRGMYEIYVNEGRSETRWQPRPPDPELEAEMLRRLMVRLGSTEEKAKTLVASEQSQERAKLTQSADGSGTLELQETFDRAWRRVGLALDRVSFTVEDRDRAQGLYFVRYIDLETDNSKKEDTGFLSKLAFWKSSKPDLNQTPQYRIFIKARGNSSIIQVLTREGGVEKSDISRKILGLLHDQLK